MNSNGSCTLLIVVDEAEDRKVLETLLSDAGHQTVSAASSEEALTRIAATAPDLVLVDLSLPGMSGREFAKTLKAAPETKDIPIIMITSRHEQSVRAAALEEGVEEFIGKPVKEGELLLRVRNLLRLKSYSDLLQDQNAVQQRLHRSENFDRLTRLPNRRGFANLLNGALAAAAKSGTKVAIAFIDVDNLKTVNEAWGRLIGDELLVCLGEILGIVLTPSDTVARLGSDEFALILPSQEGQDGMALLADKIVRALSEPIMVNRKSITISISMGLSIFPDDTSDGEALIGNASAALASAMAAGGNTFRCSMDPQRRGPTEG